MKTVRCHAYGEADTLTLDEVDDPTPGPGEVVVDVHACSLNFPDVLMIRNQYQVKPPLPFAPGGELAGVVSAVGDGVDGVSVGDRVAAVPGHGGLAERVAVPAAAVNLVPDGMDLVTAAALPIAYGTSLHALRDRARIREGETLLVLGAAGGVGLSAVEIGHLLGARVIAAASAPEKLAICREHGADETIDYAREDLRARVKELTGGLGVDVVYDPVGGPYSEPALRSIAWEGRFLVVGFAAGEIPRIHLNLTLLKGCEVVGVFWGAWAARNPERNRANLADLGRWWAEGLIRPHVPVTYPLEDAARAIADLAERRVVGKAVVVMNAAV